MAESEETRSISEQEEGNGPAQDVPSYTLEQYLNSDEPYLELYRCRADPFLHRQLVEKAAIKAKEAGLKGFKELYKSFCEKQDQKKPVVVVQNITNYNGQMAALDCGNWTCDQYGVRRLTPYGEEVACQIPITMKHRYKNIDDGTEKVKLAFYMSNQWNEIIIPCSQYATPRELVRLSDTGLPVNLRSAHVLSDFLLDLYALNYHRIPVSRSVGRMGWVGNRQFSPFVDGLFFDGRAEYAPVFDATAPRGSLEDWLTAARAFRKESTAARIVLAASFASVLIKPLGALPFFVHLWGVDSSTGKTVALMAAASVWASPEMGKYVKTFDGTDVGYERTAAFLNSLPMCIDELQLSRTQRGKVVFNVYRLTQGAGRTRGNKGGGVDVTPTWANAILTTGETPINGTGAGAGAVNRVIEIECTSAHKVVSEGRSVVQALRQNYGHAGRAFVQKLLEPGKLQRARDIYDSCFAMLNSSATTDKQAMAAALIVTADILATLWIFKDGSGLTCEELAKFLASKESVSLGVRGYEYLCDWVAQNANRMRLDVDQGDIYGILDGDWAYIINSVFKRAAEDAGYNPQALISYLRGSHLIKVSADGKSTVLKSIRGRKIRCVCLRVSPENYVEDPFNGEIVENMDSYDGT